MMLDEFNGVIYFILRPCEMAGMGVKPPKVEQSLNFIGFPFDLKTLLYDVK